jgi:hypothetical protein
VLAWVSDPGAARQPVTGRDRGVSGGAIDQAVDSVEILTQPGRRRDYAPVLGLWA